MIDIRFKRLDAIIVKLFKILNRIVQMVIFSLQVIFVKFVIYLMMIIRKRKFGIVISVNYAEILAKRIFFIVMVANAVWILT